MGLGTTDKDSDVRQRPKPFPSGPPFAPTIPPDIGIGPGQPDVSPGVPVPGAFAVKRCHGAVSDQVPFQLRLCDNRSFRLKRCGLLPVGLATVDCQYRPPSRYDAWYGNGVCPDPRHIGSETTVDSPTPDFYIYPWLFDSRYTKTQARVAAGHSPYFAPSRPRAIDRGSDAAAFDYMRIVAHFELDTGPRDIEFNYGIPDGPTERPYGAGIPVPIYELEPNRVFLIEKTYAAWAWPRAAIDNADANQRVVLFGHERCCNWNGFITDIARPNTFLPWAWVTERIHEPQWGLFAPLNEYLTQTFEWGEAAQEIGSITISVRLECTRLQLQNLGRAGLDYPAFASAAISLRGYDYRIYGAYVDTYEDFSTVNVLDGFQLTLVPEGGGWFASVASRTFDLGGVNDQSCANDRGPSQPFDTPGPDRVFAFASIANYVL